MFGLWHQHVAMQLKWDLFFLYLRLTRWRSWESSARVTAHISAPLNLAMWPGCQGIDAPDGSPGMPHSGVPRRWGRRRWTHRRSQEQGLACHCDTYAKSLSADSEIFCLSAMCFFTRASPFTSLHKSHLFTFLHVSRFFTLSQFFTAVWGGWGNRSAGFEEMFDSILTPLYQHTGYTGYTGWISTVLCWGPTGPFEERHAECLRHQLWRTGSHLMAAITAIALSWLSWKSFENKY